MEVITINPAEQRVVVLPIPEKETKTRTGIILPVGVEQDQPGMGWVIKVGKGSKDHPMIYRAGQRVVYSKYSGVDIKLNIFNHGENVYKVMNQLDIMATMQTAEK